MHINLSIKLFFKVWNMNEVEPTICNGHLPYPWGRLWRVGSWTQGMGGDPWSKTHRRGEGPKVRAVSTQRVEEGRIIREEMNKQS